MFLIMRTRMFLTLLPVVLAAQSLDEKIHASAQSSVVARRSFWGVHAVNLTTGLPVFSHHSDRTFVPASNTKLFSTALALTQLGPDHKLQTRLVADGEIDEAGTLHGNLRLIGGGDTTLSGRPVPYNPFSKPGDPMGPLEAMAEAAYSAGLRLVTGDVIGDDTAYVWDPYPPGWSQDDTMQEYGAPVSALVLHENAVRVDVRPGEEAGQRAEAEVRPANSYFFLESHVLTGSVTQVRVNRGETPRLLTLWGTVRLRDGLSIPVAIPDPAHYAAYMLRQALERRGVRFQGGLKARHRHWWNGTEPAETAPQPRTLSLRESAPLRDLIKVVNKVSQNLHAEILLREVARARGQAGSRTAALSDLSAFLRRAGVSAGDVNIVDGSGLSRLTLATPSAFTSLLSYMYAGRNREVWMDSLPVGGEDGTLGGRFKGLEGVRVMAKTGTLTHVSGLSGYIRNARGELLAFSMMINNSNHPAAAIRAFMDKVVGMLAE